MSLFDTVKEKITGLLSGASDKVTEVTGVELPGGQAADHLAQSAEDLTGTAQGSVDTATGAVQDFTGTAGETAGSAGTDTPDPRK